jgi:hypothetical protein
MAGPRLNTTESAVTTNHASHPYLIAPRVTSLIDGVAVSAQLPGHDIEIIAHVSAQQAPSKPEPVRATIEVVSQGDILTVSSPNSRVIKEQIVALVDDFHGRTLAVDSPEVQQIYALFVVALETARLSGKQQIDVCHWYTDGNFLSDLLPPAQLSLARRPSSDSDWWQDDWNYLGPVMQPWMADTNGAKRAWIAVIAYLMTHYDYVHE